MFFQVHYGWVTELNFRDEKTLLGVGEAQVRTPAAVETVPTLIVAAYAYLLLAGTVGGQPSLPPPKWRTPDTVRRDSTAHMIGVLRSQLWGKAMGLNSSHFVPPRQPNTNPLLFENSLPSAVCYAFK